MHKRKTTKPTKPAPKSPITLAQGPVTLKLDLACGANCMPDFEGVDVAPLAGVKHVMNLMEYPWPWEDNSVLELHCSHFAEHIPMIYVNDDGDEVAMGSQGARDAWFRFFDECYRVLAPDAWMTVIVPNARNNRAFQDPTHRRFHVAETFLYLSAEWRKVNALEHYNVRANFAVDVNSSVDAVVNAKADIVKAEIFNRQWNVVHDWHAKLKAIKP